MKLDKRQVICVSLGIILALAVTFVEKQDTVLTKGNGLERNTYGQGETQQEILVEGLLAKKVPLAVRIGERRYTKEEAADAIHMAAEELSAQIAGGNESLEQVQSRLELVTWLDKYGISVRWQPDDTELISASGEVFNSGCPESGRETFLTATLKAGEYAAIIGAGPIGMLAAMTALAYGAEPIMIDLVEERLLQAKQLGVRRKKNLRLLRTFSWKRRRNRSIRRCSSYRKNLKGKHLLTVQTGGAAA